LNSPLISVIVPVYNVEQYLDRCVESIVNQTYKNLEIILVDDGSTDSSGTKCDEWSKKDSRIRVIHKENGGQSSARNVGLSIATGSLIGFVDSDDYIDESMYESMHRTISDYECEIAECAMLIFYDKNEFCSIIGSGETIVLDSKEAIKDNILEKHLTSTVPNMLVKSEIAKNIQFDEGKINEDILWPYRVITSSNKVAYIDKTFYFYLQRHGSTMNSEYSEKRFDALDALESRAELVRNAYPEYLHIATRAYMGACMYHYQMLCRQAKSDEYERYKSALHTRFCKGDFDALFDGLSFKYKVWYSMFRAFPNFTCKIRNKFKIGL